MAVQEGLVGSSALLETGSNLMSDARFKLRLPRRGYMSEMVGKQREIRIVNNDVIADINLFELFGSPVEPNIFIFENNNGVTAATQSGTALTTGVFPEGSILKIINRGNISGGGGSGGLGTTYRGTEGGNGGTAIYLNYDIEIDNSLGVISGGGGGGGGGGVEDFSSGAGGGGGAGIPAGIGGATSNTGFNSNGQNGTAFTGGNGGAHRYNTAGIGGARGINGSTATGQSSGGGGGGAGAAGGSSGESYPAGVRKQGGKAGLAVMVNGKTITWKGTGIIDGPIT